MANGEDPIIPSPIPHPQGTVPGIDPPFQESTKRLDNFSGNPQVQDFWKKVLSTTPAKGEASQFYNQSEIDTTGRYNFYAPYRDTEESYARGQSTWDKIGNGLVKMGGLTASTFLQGTAGMVNGLGEWMQTGEFSKLYDNKFNRDLDAWNKKLENQFPHYYTHKEQDANWYEPSAWYTGNFLWDKIVKNLGFAAGAALSGGVYGAALKGIGLTGALVRAGRGMEALAALETTLPNIPKAERLAAFSQTMGELGVKYGIKPVGQLLTKSDRILTAALATSGEASIEALNNLNEFRNNAIEDYKKQFGTNPTGVALDRINQQAEHVGNWTFGLNTALLTGTNYIQFPKILGSSYRVEKNIANNIATQPLVRDVETGLFKSALPQAGVKKLLNKASNVAGLFFAPVEGFEEGAQYAIQRGTENYFDKKLRGEKVNWLEDGLGYGVSETLNSREGMENILIGGISGGIMTSGLFNKIPGTKALGFQGTGKLKERGLTGYGGERAVATAEALSALNRSSFKKYIQDYAEASKRAQVSQERRAMFIRQGDILEAKEEEFDFTHDYLLPRVKYGRFEAVKNDIDNYKQLAVSSEGMAQLKLDGVASEDDTQQTFLARLAGFEEHATNINALYSELNRKYSGITNEKGERKYSDDVIDRLVYASAKIKNYNSRISSLSPILSTAGVNSSSMIDAINQGKSIPAEEVKAALETINSNTDYTSDQKDDTKRVLQDVIEMGLRRKQFFKEYDKIRATPENYKPEYVSEEELKSTKVKYQDKELEVGKQYSLKDPLIREGNRLLRAPKLTILSKSLEGEYEVKLPSGRQAFLTPTELENYQLSEVDNDSPEIEQTLKAAIKEVLDKKEYATQKAGLPQTDWVDYINSLDNINLTNDIVAKIDEVVKRIQEQKRKEAEELAKIEKQKELQAQIFKSQAELKPSPDTKSPTAEDLKKEAEGKKKQGKIMFASTTSASEDEVPDIEANPRLLRERNFMHNQTFFKDRGDYKTIIITQNQEEKLGLIGLVESVAKDDTERTYTNTDVNQAPVLAVYTKSEKGVLYFVDENGEKIAKVGELTRPFTQEEQDKAKANYERNILEYEELSKFGDIVGKSIDAFVDHINESNPVTKLRKEGLSDEEIDKHPEFLEWKRKSDLMEKMVRFGAAIGFDKTWKEVIAGEKKDIENLKTKKKRVKSEELNLIDRVVVSTMPNTSTTWKDGKTSRFRAEDQPNADAFAAQWTKQREQFFKNDTYTIFDFNVSRGIPSYDNYEEEGETKYRENSVVGSLFPASEKSNILNTQGIITVAVTDKISHGGISYPTSVGRVYFTYGDRFAPLTNRQFTEKEQSTIYKLLSEMAQQAFENKGIKGRALNFIKGIMNFSTPTDQSGAPKAAGRNQIWIDKQFFLNFGNNGQKIPFTPSSLENNKEILLAFLSGTYNNINNSILRDDFGDPFEEIYTDDAGKVQSKQWKNYQHFLLDHENPYLKTPIRKLSTAVTNDRNFKQKYAILQGVEYTAKEAPKEVPKPVPVEPKEGEELPVIKVEFADGHILGRITDGKVEIVEFVHKGQKLEPNPAKQAAREAMFLNGVKAQEEKKEVKTETPVAEEVKPKEKKKPRIKGKDEEYRIARTFSIERMGEDEKAEFNKWMKKNLPQFTINEVEQLIAATGDRVAWGRMMGDVIEYYKKAEKGTGYHEAFEGVWKYFLDPANKAAIINELAARSGIFKDRETGQDTEYKEATEQQLKEKLADEFAEYKTGKHVPSISQRIKNFFDKIIKFFRSFLRGFKVNTTLVEDLFKQIETGGFKKYSIPYLDPEPEYRAIEGLTAAETHAFVQDITARFMMELFREGADMFERENYKRSDIFNIIKEQYGDTVKELPNGEKTFNELVAKTKERLAPFSITFDDNGVASINDTEQTRVEYDSSSQKMMVDVRKTQPFGVKFLLGSLYKTTGELKPDGTPIAAKGAEGNYELLPTSRTTITLLETALGSTSLDDMIDKLRGLVAENTDYIRILSRLGGKMNEGGQIDFDHLTTEQWRMLAGFYDSFNKQRPFVKEFTNENEGVFFKDMHIGTATKQVFYSWENEIRRKARNGEAIFLPYDKKEKLYKVDKKKLDEYRNAVASKTKNTSEEQLRFLNDIGITFPKEVFDKLNSTQRDSFSNAVNRILTYLGDKGGLKIIKAELTGINGPMNTLSELYARVTKPDAESTFLNGEGRQQQTFIQPNYTSQFENVFNSVANISELKESLPWLNDTYSTNSETLKLGGAYFNEDGSRTSVKLLNGYINATTTNGRRKLLKDADYQERLSVQINAILSDIFYISVPADAATEYSINLKGFMSYKELLNTDLSNDKIFATFKNYLTDEINLAKEKRESANIKGKGAQLRFFRDIISPKNVKIIDSLIEKQEDTDRILASIGDDNLRIEFNEFINKKVAAFTRTLQDAGVVEEQTDSTYAFPSLLSNYEDLNKNHLTEEEYNRISKQVWLNNFIAQTELHKVLFGDPYNFAIKGKVMDETKRIKSFLSPAQPTMTSDHYNNTFDRIYNQVGETRLDSPILGEYVPTDNTISVVIKEVEVIGQIINEKPEYKGIKEADAQAIHSILFHRDLKNRHFKWGAKEEEWLQFEEAYRRLRMNKKGQLKDEGYPEALKLHDKQLIGWNGETNNKPRPEIFFNVEKPIVRGINQRHTSIRTILDKFSSAPTWYSAVEGTALEDIYIGMLKDNIDYIILESGRKVGADEYHSLYNADGSLNADFSESDYATVDWSDYYIQQENVYDGKKSQTRGTQITKLFSLDFFSSGEPIDGDTEIAEKAAENDRLLEELTDHGYHTTLDKLGLIDNGTYFSFSEGGKKKLMKTLADEAFKRDMPENIKDIFKPDPATGEYNIPFEATSEYTKIQKMLYSLADRHIITQHYNGGNKTQMSAMGWEDKSKGRELVIKEGEKYRKITKEEYATLTDDQKKNVHLTSSRLKFYSKDDRYMEILLPNWFRDQLKRKNSKMTDAELLEYLNSTDEGKKILSGIGFRIPTQAMSQIEAFRVAGFLAAEYGDTVVVPSEITTKAGSDFDIDKLNTYLRNIYIDNKGDIKLVPYFGIGEEARKQLKDWLSKDVAEDFLLNEVNPEEDAFEGIDFEREEAAAKSKFDRMYKQSLENAYIDNLEWFITHPKNYDRLVTPTEEGDLKILAGEMAKMTEGEDVEDLTKLLDISYLSSLRQSFMSAKKWIGIVVQGITSHSISQRTNVYLDVKNTKLSQKDKEVLKDGTILLNHNKDAEGRPSISVIKNTAGKYISDTLSWFCTAIVDVAKDPYITKIIHNKKLVPTITFLTRVGVPIAELVYFINQPIIREYMKFSDEKGFSKVANSYWKDQFITLNKFSAKETAQKLDRSTFKATIQKYYDGTPLTTEENGHQKLVLDEFLKYFKMSEHLFNFSQATNWDTADFKTGGAIYKKQLVEQRENKSNIFKTPKTLLDNTFLRKMANAMGFTRQAMGTISRFENEEVRNELDQVLKPYVLLTSYQAADTLEKIDAAIISSFIDYLVQTKRGLNSSLNKILVDESTSIVVEIEKIKADPAKLDRYNNNPIFNYLHTQVSNFEKGGDNIILRPFPKQTYDKDLMTDSLRELRELEEGKDTLYSRIIRLALFQGAGNASNLLGYVPSEDFAKAIMPLIEGNLKEEAMSYAQNKNFERNKWNDDEIVPVFNPVILPPSMFRQDYKHDINFPFKEWGGKVLRLSETFNSRETEYPLLKVQKAPMIRYSADRFDFSNNRLYRRDSTIKDMIAKGDFSFMHYIGYQKVMLPNGEPLIGEGKDRDKGMVYYYYKQVNLTGDRNIQEHYTDQRPSILDNGTIKIAQEDIIPDEVIIQRVTGKKAGHSTAVLPSAPPPTVSTPVAAVSAPVKSVSAPAKINIYAGTNENATLSNFAARPFKFSYGASFTDFDNVEQAFQSAKHNYAEQSEYNDLLEEKILETESASEAKKLGGKFKNLDKKKWDNDSSKIMKDFIRESFKQNPEALKSLLATGTAELTHTQDKGKWGTEFPKLLMEVREELRSTSTNLKDKLGFKKGDCK